MEQPETWAAEWTARIAGAINEQRKVRGLSAQDLSDRCAALGYPITRPVISRIYSGQKKSITVPEVLVLAEALEVPPITLLFPLADAGTDIRYLPALEEELFVSMLRFTGESWHPDDRINTALGVDGDYLGSGKLERMRWLRAREIRALAILSKGREGWDSDEDEQQDAERLQLLMESLRDVRELLKLRRIHPRIPTHLKAAYARVGVTEDQP